MNNLNNLMGINSFSIYSNINNKGANSLKNNSKADNIERRNSQNIIKAKLIDIKTELISSNFSNPWK